MKLIMKSDGAPNAEPLIVAGIRWCLAPNVHGTIAPEMLNLEEHLRTGNARVVKHGPHRVVYNVHVDGLSLFWKQCRVNSPRGWLRQCLRPPKARMEFVRARALAARGIPTVEPLAWGVRVGEFAGDSFLITRELAGATNLQNHLVDSFGGQQRAADRRWLAASLGQFLARLHDAGVCHPDLHPGNILVTLDAGGTSQFHLIDLHDIHIGAPLSRRRGFENLVIFNRWFIVRASRSDRLRFWKSYAAARNIDSGETRTASIALERRTWTSSCRLWESRAQRCTGSNRYFRRVRSAVARGYAVRDMDPDVLSRLLLDPDCPFRDGSATILKDSRTATVAEITVPTPDGPRTMIYKRFRLKKRLGPLLNLLRPSPALRSWQSGHAMRDRGLPTPRPWLLLHCRGTIGPREGYLLYEKIEDAVDPLRLMEIASSGPPRRKWDLIAELGRLIRRFHTSRLSHRDLKAANFLWTAGSFHFIDLVGVARHRRVVSVDRRAGNLSRLNMSYLRSSSVSRTDRLRFLRAYLNWGLAGRAGWKTWWKRIDAATRAKLAKNRRNGRPIG